MGSRSRNCREDPHGASHDCDQLVHISNCLLVPNVRLFSSESSGVHPSGVLCVRHYFQVRSWFGYLSDLVRQVSKESPLAISDELVLEFGNLGEKLVSIDVIDMLMQCIDCDVNFPVFVTFLITVACVHLSSVGS